MPGNSDYLCGITYGVKFGQSSTCRTKWVDGQAFNRSIVPQTERKSRAPENDGGTEPWSGFGPLSDFGRSSDLPSTQVKPSIDLIMIDNDQK